MAPAPDGVWLTLSKQLAWFDGQRVTSVSSDLDPRAISDLRALIAARGAMWLGTSAGLFRLEGTREGLHVTRRWTRADGLPDDTIFSLAPDGDDLLVGTLRGAMRLLPDGSLRPLINPGDHRPAVVRDLLVEPDAIWAATYGEGLVRVDRAGNAKWLVRDTGFCSDELSRLLRVGEELWVNGNQGVFRLRL
jgi:ligand-binding sensor domain-containing protein